MTTLTHRNDIDGLRAFAVLPVVLHHAGVSGFSGGFVGVDVFFVISGFLIASILLRDAAENRFSIIRFYERRARRILPALFAMLAICAVFGALFLPPQPLKDLGASLQAAVFFFANIWFYQRGEGYFSPDAQADPLLHTWSLAVEEQFYIVFPLLIWLFVGRSRRGLTLVVALLCAASLVYSEAISRTAPSYNFYIVLTRAWELGIGVMLALCGARLVASKPVVETFAVLGLAGVLVPVFLYDDATRFPGLSAVPPVLGAAMIIWSGSHLQTYVSRLLSLRPFVFVGLLSYSLYLWHWPVLVAFELRLGVHDLPLSFMAVALVLSLALAWVSWRFVERPFRKPAASGFGRKAIFAQAAVGIVCLFAVASAFVETDGFKAHADPDMQRILTMGDDETKAKFEDCNIMKSPGNVCPLGVDGQPKVLVWGDSHAQAAAPGFDTYFAQVQIPGALISSAGCPPLTGTYRAYHPRRDQCSESQSFAMTYIAENPALETIVLFARWPLWVEGTRLEGEDGDTVMLLPKDVQSVGWSTVQNPDTVAAALNKMLKDFARRGLRVVLVLPVPETGRQIADQMLLELSMGAPEPVGPTRREVDARQKQSNEILRAAAARFEGVVTVAAVDHMCDQDRCRVAENGLPLYRDDDHLSAFGAKRVMPGLIQEAMQKLGDPGAS